MNVGVGVDMGVREDGDCECGRGCTNGCGFSENVGMGADVGCGGRSGVIVDMSVLYNNTASF